MSTSPQQHFSPIVKKGIDIYLKNKQRRQYLQWGSFNAFLLSIILYDIRNQCPFAHSKWYMWWLEYVLAGVFGLSTLYYFTKYIFMWMTFDPIHGTQSQRRLLHFENNDTSFITQATGKREQTPPKSSPLNSSIISWHSSFNEGNRSTNNALWSPNRSPIHSNPQSFSNTPTHLWNRTQSNAQQMGSNISPNKSNNNSFSSPYKTYSKDEIITDEHGLQKYLREVAKDVNTSNNLSYSDVRDSVDRPPSSTLWNYWNNAANLLKTSIYQLSPTTVSPTKQTTSKELIGKNFGPGCSDLAGTSEIFKSVSTAKLTRYVTNLRMWISATILQRLVKEFDTIDSEFAARGFSDIKIGSVGIERLKKTVENHMVSSYVPTLAKVIPFLDMTSNQEYLVRRIRELAKGSGINDYRWNSSNAYDSNWDEHVTTDAAIIFHLFCAYVDSQLMPLPQPGGRPFYNRYVVIGDKKSIRETIEEVKAKSKTAIMVNNPTKPKFNFISDDKVHHCSHDRNNLFCVIIHFLIYMRERNSGLLDGVNLGRSGLNILAVTED